MSAPLYTITSAAKGPEGQTLYLDATNGSLQVTFVRAASSLWQVQNNNSYAGTSLIINSANGQYLLNRPGENLAALYPQPLAPNCCWEIVGTGQVAIRPFEYEDINLNICGDVYPSGSRVILFKWDNQPNSKWILTQQPAGSNPHPTTTTSSAKPRKPSSSAH